MTPPDSCKCKKVSGTKMAKQKRRNKIYSLFRVTQTKIGGDSASAKRSAEQKLVGTVSHWVMGTPSASAKRSAEQKLWNKNSETKNCGTKIAEQNFGIELHRFYMRLIFGWVGVGCWVVDMGC